jgi:alpha-L-fucosidase
MKPFFVKLFFVMGCLGSLTAQQRFQATWPSLSQYQIPDWYRDAKFGIFIHWGVYSVPAFGSEWYPHEMYLQGSDVFKHHLATYGSQRNFGYKDFIPMFKAEHFDPDQWAALFKKSGAKYVIPVAEHHDGFAMYNTSLSKWNAYNMGPKRDVIGELAVAVRKQGLIFGVSSHRIEHWFFMNGGRAFDSDVKDTAYEDFYGPARNEKDSLTSEYMNDWLMRSIELVNKYHPQVFWFDWWIEQPAMEPYRKSFANYYYNQALVWKKGVVINYKNKSFPEQAAVLDLERGKMAGIREPAWQTDDAVGFKSWGYINGENYKSVQYLVDELIDIVSKNGNLLLNIGPRSDGTIPEEQQQLLLSIGKWLEVNGEAIYATRPWKIFGEGPTENIGGSFIDGKVQQFGSQDVRFTTKGKFVYAIVLSIPSPGTAIHIKSLSSNSGYGKIGAVELLGSPDKISWIQHKDELLIKPIDQYPSGQAAAFRISFE